MGLFLKTGLQSIRVKMGIRTNGTLWTSVAVEKPKWEAVVNILENEASFS